MTPLFRLTIKTAEAPLYAESMPPMPVPQVGQDVYVGGDGRGWWTVVSVWWVVPSMKAPQPTMEAVLDVEWSLLNDRPAPTYGDNGWVEADD